MAEAGSTGGMGNAGAAGAGTGGTLTDGGTADGAGGASPGDGGSPDDTTVCGTQPFSQWTPTSWTEGNSFFRLEASRGQVFARIWDSLTGGRMFLTTDKGASWARISSADTDLDLLSVIAVNGGLLAASWEGFYNSTSGGAAWTAVAPTGAPASAAVLSIARIGTTLFAATMGDVYQSADDGSTWTDAGAGLPANSLITSIAAYGQTILAGTQSSGVYAMTGGGATWTAVNSGLTETHIAQLAVVGSKAFAVTLGGVFVSENGTSWAADGASPANTNCMLVVNGQVLAGTDDTGVYLSADVGGTWTPLGSGMPAATRVWSLAASNDSLFAGTDTGVWRAGCTP